ncbi:virulence factor BrkB family protein [Aliidiomarina maris]|uniref:UPF0761 membrane protein B0I24_10941 n=1 Tax=Aliidiomarina maris TaxID=531312 RepID=A0A327WWR6_9GAMM|nr:virulence factor BrkB family protein [Aliidiomarina maris]MCL5051338.1 virulence factor BrkB family protein [Bacillota bacterium]RAJ96360.1 tRNA-processing RNAse BN [Aliidiomarina maris]RUO22861.1 YihY/virulence factor BrkB family protein [Aliidiomarina maris]
MINWHRQKILLFGGGKHTFKFLKAFVNRCLEDKVSVTAGHLTYVTMLSLVPMVAVIVSVMASLPAFQEIRETMQDLVMANLVPSTGEALESYFGTFIENAHQLSAIGVSFLFVVAIMLMSNIDKSLNRIWRITKKRRFVVSLAVYWMILTLGPVLIGLSIGASSYLLALTAAADEYVRGINSLMLTLLPLISTTVAFLLIYVLVPNKVVRVRHAFWGALAAAVLFEFAKNAFSMYLQYFPTYERVYGAVATIPILIVWIYLSWNIILIGAEVTATVEEYRGENKPAMNREEAEQLAVDLEPDENDNKDKKRPA